MNPSETSIGANQIRAAHELYCALTGQQLTLGFDRERLWFELLRQGHTPEDIRCVVLYLQKEIRHQRRNVGALKLSNLLQPDRFEEDLNISRVRLRRPQPPAPHVQPQPLDPNQQRLGREAALRHLRRLKSQLRQNTTITSTDHLGNISTD